MRGGDIFMGAFNAEQVMYNHFGYRSPIPNLYNAGSAGHPGGAISGGAGYISAGIIARDLGLKPWWTPWDARAALEAIPADRRRGVSDLAQHRIPRRCKDRVVIITGAGQGIGRVFAKAFALAGARAVIAEINEAKAAAVSEEIMRAGGEALAVTTDVAEEASIKEMVEIVDRRLRPHRRADQQCRHLLDAGDAPVRPDPARGMGARAARQPDRAVSVRARGAAGDAARAMGPHHQRRLRRGAAGAAELSALHRHQIGARRHEPVDGARTRARTTSPSTPFCRARPSPKSSARPSRRSRSSASSPCNACRARKCRRTWSAPCCSSPREASAFVTGQSINLDGGVTGS